MVGEDVDPDYRAPVAAAPRRAASCSRRATCAGAGCGASISTSTRARSSASPGSPAPASLELPYVLAGGVARQGQRPDPAARALRRVARRQRRRAARACRSCLLTASARRSSPSSRSSENISLSVLDRLEPPLPASTRRPSASSSSAGPTGSGSSPPAPTRRSRRSAAAISRRSIIARCLGRDAGVLLLCEPTAGVDIGTRVSIYELIAGLAADGLTVIVASSDEGDLLGDVHAHRRAARRAGRRRDGPRRTHTAGARQRHGGRAHCMTIHPGAPSPGGPPNEPTSHGPPARPPLAKRFRSRPRVRQGRRGLRLARDHRRLLDLGAGDVPERRDREADPELATRSPAWPRCRSRSRSRRASSTCRSPTP